jgi:AGCS family alanine or glycine:cation symporter
MNIGETGRVFGDIFRCAFSADALLSGGIGVAIQQGVKRGTFSSASGMGEATPTAAAAEITHPVKVGLANAAGVWLDTVIVRTASALMILYSDCYNTAFGYVGSGHPGMAELTGGSAVMVQYAASTVMGGIAEIFIAFMLFLFSFTCLISYYYEAETASTYLFQKPEQAGIRKGITWFLRIAMPALIFYYGIVGAAMAWNLADLALGSITFFNMLVVVLLAKPVKAMLKDYEAQKKAGKDPYYNPDNVSFKGVDVELWKDINSNYIAANK